VPGIFCPGEIIMLTEVAVWFAAPLVGAAVAVRRGLALAPVMAGVTGITIIVGAVAEIAMDRFLSPPVRISSGLQDTYYVIAFNHSALQVGAMLILVALPLAWIARSVQRPAALGAILFVTLHIGIGLSLFPQAAMSGQPRRYVEYVGYFEAINRISFAGAMMSFVAFCGIALATLVALYRMWQGRRTG
jgi:heme/copper-type cytochrome/quinol oxidase subunit 1